MTDMKDLSLADARKNLQYEAKKKEKKKERRKNRDIDKAERSMSAFGTSQVLPPLSEEGRSNYEKIFGHK